MDDRPIPTPEGLRRWPHTRGYHPDLSAVETEPDMDLPCTCAVTCAPRCAGECGCRACDFAFAEFCDAAGLSSAGVPDETALTRYREVVVIQSPPEAR